MIRPEHLPLIFTIGLTSVAVLIAFSIQPLAGLMKQPETADNNGYQCICPPQSDYIAVVLSILLLMGIMYIIKKLTPNITTTQRTLKDGEFPPI